MAIQHIQDKPTLIQSIHRITHERQSLTKYLFPSVKSENKLTKMHEKSQKNSIVEYLFQICLHIFDQITKTEYK
jgi:hypothetical protein